MERGCNGGLFSLKIVGASVEEFLTPNSELLRPPTAKFQIIFHPTPICKWNSPGGVYPILAVWTVNGSDQTV